VSNLGLKLERPTGHRAQRPKRRGLGCIVTLLVVALVCVAGYLGIEKGTDALRGWLGPPPDYQGQGSGSGSAEVEIAKGDSIAQIGRTLEEQGVVASVDAFVDVAQQDPRSLSIQPALYELREKMAAKWALEELLDTANRIQGAVTIPEGARVDQVVKLVAKNTDIKRADLVAALEEPGRLGLPRAAGGNPEGYLFPATYHIRPDADADDVLRQMVKKAKEVKQQMHIDRRAERLGLSAREAVIVASIIEYEARRNADLPKVARVIYNRLDADMALQMDSTVSYISNRKGDPWTTDAERSSSSAYNTYKHKGLPPGPIGSPGEETLRAALEPAEGDWMYFVTTNFETGETKFTDSYAEHQKNVAESKKYCRSSKLC